MKTLKIKISFVFLLFSFGLFAQGNPQNIIHYNQWLFGEGPIMMDFNSGQPQISFPNISYDTYPEPSIWCDDTGQLLLYCNGIAVYNRNHQIMPNGNNLIGANIGSQSSLIIPYPDHPNLFYVFVNDEPNNSLYGGTGGFYYNIVDMTLDSGLGDVADTAKNKLLFAPTAWRVAGVRHANKRDYWVVAHEWDTNNFYVYLVDTGGLHLTPQIISAGSVYQDTVAPDYVAETIGFFRFNLQSNLLISTIHEWPGYPMYPRAELFLFNNTTGSITPVTTLTMPYNQEEDPCPSLWGASFSPGGSKLYLQNYNYLLQYDVSILDSATIANSQIIMGPYPYLSDIQMSPLGIIFTAHQVDGENYLGCIYAPDSTGIACNYIDTAYSWTSNQVPKSFPNLILSYFDGIEPVAINQIFNPEKNPGVYPNPVSGILTISNIPSGNTIAVYSIQGKLIKTYADTKQIDVSSLTKGMYLLKIEIQEKTMIRKFVKY